MELDASDSTMLNNGDNINKVTDNNGLSNGVSFSGLKSDSDTDIVRLIGQHLISMGLKETVDLLIKESGLEGLDHPLASKLQQHILGGEWERAKKTVELIASHLEGDKKSNIDSMKLMIAEQKFLELIEDNHHIQALKCLRSEISPLTNDMKKVQHLATILMCKSVEDVKQRTNWKGKGHRSRQELIEKFQHYIPPLIMLPPERLKILLSQAIQLQQERCTLHMASPDLDYADLKTDHKCSSDNFPLESRQESDNHKTEVWYCKFSNDGTKLATGGLGGKVKIWDVNPVAQKLTERCTLDCNSYSITCLSWSPDDAYLLACGSEDQPDLWLWDVHKEEVHRMINHTDDECTTTCSWHLSGDKFAAASLKGNFNIYDMKGERLGGREGVRVQCLSFLHKDPDFILAADSLNRIKSYAIDGMNMQTFSEDIIEEKFSIMSFTLDREDKYIAVNLMQQGVNLWDFRLKTLLRMFPGVCQRNFTIYSSFSSPNPTFLASGSEDGKVYIYHVNKDQPVAILHGHSRCVNCVTWNPKFPGLLVSVSDDRIVRLWGPVRAECAKSDRLVANSRK